MKKAHFSKKPVAGKRKTMDSDLLSNLMKLDNSGGFKCFDNNGGVHDNID